MMEKKKLTIGDRTKKIKAPLLNKQDLYCYLNLDKRNRPSNS